MRVRVLNTLPYSVTSPLSLPTLDLLTKPYSSEKKVELKTSAGGINYVAEAVIGKACEWS